MDVVVAAYTHVDQTMASNPPNQPNNGHKNNNQKSDGQANKTNNQKSDGQANNNTNQQSKKRPIFSKSLGTAAGLSKLLPTGTTLAFQTMAPSFTRGGECEDHDVNFAFTCGLIIFLTLLTAALNFTDSVQGTDGNTHYGVATRRGLTLFNHGRELVRDSKVKRADLKRRRLRRQDVLQAVVSAAVFLALAFCDAGVQRCLVRKESRPWKDFFTHLPLAVGFLATFLFIIFPSTRKGIGEDGAWGGADGLEGSKAADAHEEKTNSPAESEAAPAVDKDDAKKKKKELEERKATTLLGAAATLSKLLPTGTTLAFQTMAPSFTNGGDCRGHRVNFAFTWGLICLLTLICAVVRFTDSVTDQYGHTYYGLATCNGLWLFNIDPKDLRGIEWVQWEKFKLRWRDFLHAVVSAAVFVAVAFCDAGVQNCLVPEESTQWREFLGLLPLAVAFLASFLFVIFPSDRKGIGEEGAAYWHLDTDETKQQQGAATESAAISVARVAPSDVVQLDNAV